MSEREKLTHRVCARLDEATVTEIDAYQRERERTACTPLSRSVVMRELLEAWAQERARARADRAERGAAA